MAETQEDAAGKKVTPPSTSQPRSVVRDKSYALPVPIRTFPLPSFYPNTPVSILHVAFAWLKYALFPPPPEPAVVHQGMWSPETRSVIITDPKSMEALWSQGFFGKGSLSRSEPNWLERDKVKRGLAQGHVSELLTVKRRQERANAKWERGRIQQEAIDRQQQEESEKAARSTTATSEVGLDDRPAAILSSQRSPNGMTPGQPATTCPLAPVGPLQLLALPNSAADLAKRTSVEKYPDEGTQTEDKLKGCSGRIPALNGLIKLPSHQTLPTETSAEADVTKPANGDVGPGPLKRRKSVRFSPKVESTTFLHSDPPRLDRSISREDSAARMAAANGSASTANGSAGLQGKGARTSSTSASDAKVLNKEHLQLSIQEAFYLSYALGALSVLDPQTGAPLDTKQLLTLFRQYSYFPPRVGDASTGALSPDDPFLLDYVVYHHFRSLGWVPRHGTKFGVDWLLYQRGPVFEHAEFGIIVLPAYSDPRWKDCHRQASRRTWHWLLGVMRVLSHVYKALVLVYVDVPPPPVLAAEDGGISALLAQYKIREIMVRRWSSNRNR